MCKACFDTEFSVPAFADQKLGRLDVPKVSGKRERREALG